MERPEIEQLKRYLNEGIHSVGGWCNPHLWQALWPLRPMIGAGPIAEIGVFEGKFFAGLAQTFRRSGPPDLAIDVFDMQEFNIDNAGVGKKQVFLDNVEKHSGTKPVIWHRDSLTLNDMDVQEVWREFDGFACFSVDGCHTVEHTVNDLQFAMRTTRPGGVIILDDYTNANWPGVAEAVARMYILGSPSMLPLAVTCNKLFLCSYSVHDTYLKAIWEYNKGLEHRPNVKVVKRFGFDTLTLQPRLNQPVEIRDPEG